MSTTSGRSRAALSTACAPSAHSPTTSISGSALEDHPEARPDELLVVDEQDPDHASHRAVRGSEPRRDREAAVGARTGLHAAAVEADALPHAHDAVPRARRCRAGSACMPAPSSMISRTTSLGS